MKVRKVVTTWFAYCTENHHKCKQSGMKEIARLFPARLYLVFNKSVKWLDDAYELSAETVVMHLTPENMGAVKANIQDDDSSDDDGDCLNSKQRDALYPESEQHHPVWPPELRVPRTKGTLYLRASKSENRKMVIAVARTLTTGVRDPRRVHDRTKAGSFTHLDRFAVHNPGLGERPGTRSPLDGERLRQLILQYHGH